MSVQFADLLQQSISIHNGVRLQSQNSTQLPIDFHTQSAKLPFAVVGKSSGNRNRILNECVSSTSTIDILMFMALAFDTLQAAKQLQKSGFAEPQAEAIVSIVSDKHEELATKSDVEILRMDLENFREATKTDIENLRKQTQVYGEIASDNKNWLRWGMGLNSAMLLVIIGYLLSQ